MRLRLTGLALTLLPIAWWAWDIHHDPCGLQGDAWQQCWSHHSMPTDAPVSQPERNHSTHHTDDDHS